MNKAENFENTSQDDDIFDGVIMLDDVDFLTKAQTREIISRVKQGIKDLNNPEKWMTWEEFIELEKANGFYDIV